jgi:PAS domain S-box-containing protein
MGASVATPETNNPLLPELFRSICDNAEEGILVLKAEAWRIVYANPNVCRLFGYTASEFQDVTLEMLDPTGTLASFFGSAHTSLQQEKAVVEAIPCQRKDGGRFYIHLRTTNIVVDHMLYAVGFFTEITLRTFDQSAILPLPNQRLEAILKQIRESEEKFRMVFEESPYGMVLSDVEHRILRANAAFCNLIGYDENEVRLYGFRKFLYPDDLRVVDENLAAWEVGQSEIIKTETRYYTKNQDVVWAAVTVTKIRGAEGALLYNLAILEDITERKHTEQALRESEELFRRLVEGAPETIYVQTEGKISFINSAGCALLGAATSTDLLGLDLMTRIHPDYRKLTRLQVHKTNQDQPPSPPLEAVYLKLDGSSVPVEVTAVPVQFQGRNGSLVFVRDITLRKRTELTLRNAQKLESIGVLAGGIAHDFNNLLSGLFGNVDLAQIAIAQRDWKETSALLKNAMGVLDRSRALTRQLLTFAKGGTPVKKPILIGQLLSHSTTFALSGSNVRCDFAMAQDLWLCQGDENQIAQVIDNIVINARQAMPMGGTITVCADNIFVNEGTHPILSKGPYIKVTISDTGTGIPKELKGNIFDPFFTTKEQGSGLGLAIAYSIIKRHEGAIDVESEPGQGTTLFVYLPATKDPNFPNTELFPSDHQGTGDILIVDDEPIVLKVLSKILQNMGFSTVVADNGEDALRIAREMIKAGRNFRAAILDLTIPGGRGGREIVGELVGIDPSIKTIVSSGYHDDPVLASPQKFGFHAKLNKPYSIQEVGMVFERLFGKQD